MMKNKKRFGIILLALLLFSMINFISAEQNVCCEKTTSGAWCQNDVESNCDANYNSAPTSCDSTSYCKQGCCYDSQEGLCMENTPQRVCSDSGATWADSASCSIQQCQLGCCILGDQGAFVTLARCKSLTGFYGLETDFSTVITDELTCIATAQGADKGACVVEDSATLTNTCVFTTRESCPTASLTAESTNNSENESEVGFYKDTLCSAEELGSICGPSTDTTLVDGKDEVYWKDSCGNVANIYDSSKIDDEEYWKRIYDKSESCGYGSSNAGSSTCGNCDYYLGSIGKDENGATYGDYVCVDLSCADAERKHGESWCVTDSPAGGGQDTVGSRYYKQICVNNEVLTEPCSDYRNQICIANTFNGFSEAACRTNRWQDCVMQVEEADCENLDQRECMWIDGYYYSANSGQIEKIVNESQAEKEDIAQTPTGLCVPNYPPGLQFWSSDSATTSSTSGNSSATSEFGTGYVESTTGSSSATAQCAIGNAKVTFKWEKVKRMWPFESENWECANDDCKKYVTDESKAEISDAEAEKWAEDMNQICYTLGDCGGYINWIGEYTDDGFAAYNGQERIAGSGGSEILEATEETATATTASTTGSMIKDWVKTMGGK